MEELAPHIEYELKGDKLLLSIDIGHEGEPSKSGKSIVIGSTRGNIKIPGTELKLGLNLYKPV